MDSISKLQNEVQNRVIQSLLFSRYLSYAPKLERQILFELIRDYYIQSIYNPTSTIYKHCGGVGNEEIVKRYSRYLKYADYYRTINNEFLKEYAGTDITELVRQPMTELKDHFSGVYLSEYQFLQLDCICDIPLLRVIISKRITNVKTVSNGELQDLFAEYRDILVHNKTLKTNDNDILMWFFNFFSLESRYQVLSVYKAASLLSKYNNSKSKEKFSDDEKTEMLKLFATLVVDNQIIIENTLLPIRLKIIGQLQPGNVISKVQQYTDLIRLKTTIKHSIRQLPGVDVQKLLSSLEPPEIRKFIEEEYNISEFLEPV